VAATGPNVSCVVYSENALPHSAGICRPAFDKEGIQTDVLSSEKCHSHFVLQVSQTLFLALIKLPFPKEPSDPNTPARNAELFRTLLPQLFAQFDLQSATEPLAFWNTQRETAETGMTVIVAATHPIPGFAREFSKIFGLRRGCPFGGGDAAPEPPPVSGLC